MRRLRSTHVNLPVPRDCGLCGRKLTEGYSLTPQSDEVAEFVSELQGQDVYESYVGECCFGGFCGVKGASDADDWLEYHGYDDGGEQPDG